MTKKKIGMIAAISAAVIAVVVLCIVLFGGKDAYRKIKVQQLNGKSEVARADKGVLDTYSGMFLENGDMVSVLEQSDMVLNLDDIKFVYVEEKTKFTLQAEGKEKKGKMKISITEGSALIEIQEKLSGKETFEVETPNSVMAVRGTVFFVSVEKNEADEPITVVQVFEGTVAAENQIGADEGITVDAGEELTVVGEKEEKDTIVLTEVSEHVLEWLTEMEEKDFFFEEKELEDALEEVKKLGKQTPTPTPSPTPSPIPTLAAGACYISNVTPETILNAEAGVIITEQNGWYGAVNYAGEELVPSKYACCVMEPDKDGYFALGGFNQKIYIFDRFGEEVVPVNNPSKFWIKDGKVIVVFTREVIFYDIETEVQKTVRLPYIYASALAADGSVVCLTEPDGDVTHRVAIVSEEGMTDCGGLYYGYGIAEYTVGRSENTIIPFYMNGGDAKNTLAFLNAQKPDDSWKEDEMYAHYDMFPKKYHMEIGWDGTRGNWSEILEEDATNVTGMKLVGSFGTQVVLDVATYETEYSILLDYSAWSNQTLENTKDLLIATYDTIRYASSGNYLAGDDETYFYMDLSGTVLSEMYDAATAFQSDGYAMVRKGETAYLIDTKFQPVIEVEDVKNLCRIGELFVLELTDGTKKVLCIPEDKTPILEAEGKEPVQGPDAFPTQKEGIGYYIVNDSIHFVGNGTLTSEDVPMGYMNLLGLKTVVIEGDIEAIAAETFGSRYGSSCTGMEQIILNDKIQSIGDAAFAYCTSLKSIVLPKGLTKISDYLFMECTALQELEIPDGVTYIGERAFLGTAIKDITLPDGVSYIGNSAFQGSAIQTLDVPDSVTYFGSGQFRNTGIVSLVCPKQMKEVGYEEFLGCENLVTLVLPEGITSIPARAFYNCSSLKSIVIPKSVTSIGENAFWGCDSLETLKIPEGVKTIEKDAIDGDSLKSVTFPGSLRLLKAVFDSCPKLTELYIAEGITAIDDNVFRDIYPKETLHLWIPASVIDIGAYNWWTTDAHVKNIILHTPAGSYAEKWAKDYARNYGQDITIVNDWK